MFIQISTIRKSNNKYCSARNYTPHKKRGNVKFRHNLENILKHLKFRIIGIGKTDQP
jgi:hypothetical protein